jgi:signal transduction histidine kinase
MLLPPCELYRSGAGAEAPVAIAIRPRKRRGTDRLRHRRAHSPKRVFGAKEDVVVHGDRDLLFEAVANLVDNAVKFTPKGGRVEASLHRREDEVVARVCDTGPGIAAGERDLVGRRFYRGDKSRCAPGLGLGLSLVNATVKLHGFRFSISPGPGCVAEIAGQRASA